MPVARLGIDLSLPMRCFRRVPAKRLAVPGLSTSHRDPSWCRSLWAPVRTFLGNHPVPLVIRGSAS